MEPVVLTQDMVDYISPLLAEGKEAELVLAMVTTRFPWLDRRTASLAISKTSIIMTGGVDPDNGSLLVKHPLKEKE